jgi:hypothetical protein
MAVAVGRIDWTMDRDKEGHRHYTIAWLVKASFTTEGPASAITAAGLPAVGTAWSFGLDVDAWAFCTPITRARPALVAEPGVYWIVEQTFSTKPLTRCQDTPIEDPLMEPPVINGSFTKFVRAAIKDRFDDPIENSAKELITDPEIVEKDEGYPTVVISMNVLNLDLEGITAMMHHLNDAPMWGLEARHIKLSDWRWERLLFGVCSYYYRVTFEFEVNPDGWDRVAFDIGTKFLMDGGDPDNQDDYVKYKDANGELSKCFLKDGAVLPEGDPPEEIDVELYDDADLLSLGIPMVL